MRPGSSSRLHSRHRQPPALPTSYLCNRSSHTFATTKAPAGVVAHRSAPSLPISDNTPAPWPKVWAESATDQNCSFGWYNSQSNNLSFGPAPIPKRKAPVLKESPASAKTAGSAASHVKPRNETCLSATPMHRVPPVLPAPYHAARSEPNMTSRANVCAPSSIHASRTAADRSSRNGGMNTHDPARIMAYATQERVPSCLPAPQSTTVSLANETGGHRVPPHCPPHLARAATASPAILEAVDKYGSGTASPCQPHECYPLRIECAGVEGMFRSLDADAPVDEPLTEQLTDGRKIPFSRHAAVLPHTAWGHGGEAAHN